MNIFNQALVFIFGFLYGARFDELNFTQSQISLVMNVSSVFTNLSGLFIGVATEYFSLRQVGVFGSAMISCGLALSSLATSLRQFILTYSLMVGLGFGFMGSAAFLAVCSYFTTGRNRAVSLAMSGTAIGQILLPQIVKLLMPVYGSRGTILIVGALALNGLIGALLFQPVMWHCKNNEPEKSPSEVDPLLKETKACYEKSFQRDTLKTRMRNVIDVELIKDVRFLILNVGLSCGYTIIIDFSTLLPFFLQVSFIIRKPNYFKHNVFVSGHCKLRRKPNSFLFIHSCLVGCFFSSDVPLLNRPL